MTELRRRAVYSTETGKLSQDPIALKKGEAHDVELALDQHVWQVGFSVILHNGAVQLSVISNRGVEVPYYRHLSYDRNPRPMCRTILWIPGSLRFHYARNYADSNIRIRFKGLGEGLGLGDTGVVTGDFNICRSVEVPSAVDQLALLDQQDPLTLQDRRALKR